MPPIDDVPATGRQTVRHKVSNGWKKSVLGTRTLPHASRYTSVSMAPPGERFVILCWRLRFSALVVSQPRTQHATCEAVRRVLVHSVVDCWHWWRCNLVHCCALATTGWPEQWVAFEMLNCCTKKLLMWQISVEIYVYYAYFGWAQILRKWDVISEEKVVVW